MTIRKTLDEMNSNDLDALYERVATAEQEADDSVTAAARLTTLVGKRSEKAERAAKRQRGRADIAETELRVLRSGLRALGGDPTQIQNLWAQIRLRNRQWREEKQRAEQAEAAVERVRALAARIRQGAPWTANNDNIADHLHAALDSAPEGHIYLSTGCHHGDQPFTHGLTGHEYCQAKTGLAGGKQPAQCKGQTCGARCICDCHDAAGHTHDTRPEEQQ